ncbi:hypothetical protein DPEC_G00027440 [Dallia pectoralis]|uniref:Uncharacterized protein n=1 Tax=Dallia pectoralis TaxID=75939 RepID=A0ACC2HIT8_DALPE|nr:hypothetical protein DPEC_G00027440 [Dallia pectoralis]
MLLHNACLGITGRPTGVIKTFPAKRIYPNAQISGQGTVASSYSAISYRWTSRKNAIGSERSQMSFHGGGDGFPHLLFQSIDLFYGGLAQACPPEYPLQSNLKVKSRGGVNGYTLALPVPVGRRGVFPRLSTDIVSLYLPPSPPSAAPSHQSRVLAFPLS